MIRYLQSLTLLFILGNSLCATEKIHLTIRYLGLPVVRVKMIDDGEEIRVTAKATTIASIAASMDNKYFSTYSDDYLTERYRKIINQRGYHEDRITMYDRDGSVARRTSYILPERDREYPIVKDSRDFFSALFYLREMVNTQSQGVI